MQLPSQESGECAANRGEKVNDFARPTELGDFFGKFIDLGLNPHQRREEQIVGHGSSTFVTIPRRWSSRWTAVRVGSGVSGLSRSAFSRANG